MEKQSNLVNVRGHFYLRNKSKALEYCKFANLLRIESVSGRGKCWCWEALHCDLVRGVRNKFCVVNMYDKSKRNLTEPFISEYSPKQLAWAEGSVNDRRNWCMKFRKLRLKSQIVSDSIESHSNMWISVSKPQILWQIFNDVATETGICDSHQAFW